MNLLVKVADVTKGFERMKKSVKKTGTNSPAPFRSCSNWDLSFQEKSKIN